MDQKLPGKQPAYATENPSLLVWQLNALWENIKMRAISKVSGISSLQYMVMVNIKWLVCTREEITQAQLAEHLGMEAMNVSQVLKILTTKGYIIRKQHSVDTRAKAVFLSKKGESVTDLASQEIAKAEKQFFKVLGKDLKRFMDDMSKLVAQYPG
jgi:DNA-binding MarR family transcriptional regulator